MPEPYKWKSLAGLLSNPNSSTQPYSCISLSEENKYPSLGVQGQPKCTAHTAKAEKVKGMVTLVPPSNKKSDFGLPCPSLVLGGGV